MADKKDTKKMPKDTEKDDKISVEEIKKRKEEVLARIDAEIGDEISDEVVIDEKTDKEISERESKEALEKEMLAEEVKEEEPERQEEKEEKVSEKVEEEVIEAKEEEKDESRSTFSAAEFGLSDKKSNKGKNILLFAVVFLLVAIVSALFYFFFTGALKFEKPTPEPEATPTETPSPTPTPEEFDRAELSVQVLNGSGVSGAAGSMETILEDLGYENIEIGNADNSDYENITIQVKEEFEDLAELIDKDLADEFTVNSEYEILDEDSEYDVVIIVGSEPDSESEDTEAEDNSDE